MERENRKAKLSEALIVFIILILVMGISIVVFGSDPHIPMFIGVVVSALMALKIGHKWDNIEDYMVGGITQALQSIIILAIIGILIGVWIVSGVVPTMISYGLRILSPNIFLPAAVLLTSITSIATGTSWGTMGTMGIALMGIAGGLNIPGPLAAGAIISGAYFGDKMSPLSDTTNLAPAMAGTDVFTHIKYMFLPTLVAYGITLIFFVISGLSYGGSGANLSDLEVIQEGLNNLFNINPILFLPPLVVIISIALKVPAIPGIVLGIFTAALLGVFVQGNNVGDLLDAAFSGYESTTGVLAIDDLLTNGGLENMMYSISLTIIAMMFGGIAENVGYLSVLLEVILKFVKTAAGLITATIVSCIFSNATMPEQYISIVVPGRMFAETYKEKNIHPATLSAALEAGGTVTSPLIPWNTCGAFIKNNLGLSALEYGPFAVFNIAMPLVTILFAYLGPMVSKMTKRERKILDEKGVIKGVENK